MREEQGFWAETGPSPCVWTKPVGLENLAFQGFWPCSVRIIVAHSGAKSTTRARETAEAADSGGCPQNCGQPPEKCRAGQPDQAPAGEADAAGGVSWGAGEGAAEAAGGSAVGVASGLGEGAGAAEGVTWGEGLPSGPGVASGEGLGSGEGVTSGEGEGVTSGLGEGSATAGTLPSTPPVTGSTPYLAASAELMR